ELPIEGRGNLLALECVGHRLTREQAAPVDPRSKICRNSHIRRSGDDTAREFISAASDLVEDRAKTGLRGHGWLDGDAEAVRYVEGFRRQSPHAGGRESYLLEKSLNFFRGDCETFELVPLVPGTHAHGVAKSLHLLRRHQ